jgi:hypothetical protein
MSEDIIYKAYDTYLIKNKEIIMISDDIDGVHNTVVGIDNVFYYLENEYPGILAAIFAWEYSTKTLLSKDELKQIMNDNVII